MATRGGAMNTYYVYIMTTHSRTPYIGVSNDLERRVLEHRTGEVRGFTSRYRMTQLVYYEQFAQVVDAIAREKQLKGWTRAKKIALVERDNPHWENLARDWFEAEKPAANAPFVDK